MPLYKMDKRNGRHTGAVLLCVKSNKNFCHSIPWQEFLLLFMYAQNLFSHLGLIALLGYQNVYLLCIISGIIKISQIL